MSMLPEQPVSRDGAESDDAVAAAARRFINFVLVPAWLVWGLADYACHRRSDIEHTSGTHESLTHVLMISTSGVGIMAGMFFEVNGLVLSIMAASALAATPGTAKLPSVSVPVPAGTG